MNPTTTPRQTEQPKAPVSDCFDDAMEAWRKALAYSNRAGSGNQTQTQNWWIWNPDSG